MKKNVDLIAQYIIGFVFVVSAITKLIDIDEFQVFIYSLNVLNLDLSILLSQFIIGLELTIGLLYMFRIYTKVVSLFTIGFVFILTIFVLYLKFSNVNGDCHCFGSTIQLSVNTTIIKNIILFLIILYAYLGRTEVQTKFKHLLLGIAIAIGFFSTVLVYPPNFLNTNSYKTDTYYSKLNLDKFTNDNGLTNERRVLCFLSTECKYCKLAAKKMTIISKKLNNNKQIYYVFWSVKSDSKAFFKKTESYPFHFVNLNVIEFLKITNGTMPLILLYDKGVVKKAFRYKDLDEEEIIKFLEQK